MVVFNVDFVSKKNFYKSLINKLRVQGNNLRFGYESPFGNQPISANLGIVNANRDSTLDGVPHNFFGSPVLLPCLNKKI